MKILNPLKKTFLAQNAAMADRFFSRLKGLIGRNQFADGEALIITRCQSIHMFFMRFSIDVVFVDKQQRVVGLVKDIKPFQVSPHFFKACWAIELPAGTIEKSHTELDDPLIIE